MKFCPNCGNALQPGVKFCPACGMKIEAMQSVSDQPEAPETNGQSTKSNDLQATGLTDAATIQSTQSVTDAQPTQQVQTSQQTAYEQQAQFNQPRNNQRAQQAIPDQPQLGFVGSVQYVLQHAFEFNGNVPESRKSVFWWGYLGMCIISIILAFIPVVGVLLDIAVQVLLISACMRRLAYIGQNTGVAWLLIIPVVGLYPYFLMLLDRKAA
ncbi:zinc-ribbon domain-containing protein [Secundilactobacillus similis]|uniref:Zinc-ribbon domain-containing protein n=1 Tax=Secundilactobacillus similis DSM 23365 = JCM 2765 TaxID=1423804 RepID=A0A0R2FEC1_9LACO|nr:zinc-ribbon domain-containing protein [Secundilactobacillus similis]KRN26808.1 hypothetical protein FD14_GL000040 [Secundilactobacillus similis DSM 23365 = JCM 2765]